MDSPGLYDRRKGWLRDLKAGDEVRMTSPNGLPSRHTVHRVTPAGKIDVMVGDEPMRFHWTGYAWGWFQLEPVK